MNFATILKVIFCVSIKLFKPGNGGPLSFGVLSYFAINTQSFTSSVFSNTFNR
ncbi:Uncharacterised protein [Salmonella enterica]|uniref:Uncharacterized protein n=1 Tax=Salmonella enterica TaxID=28901 RepID=A0A379Q7A6_SALER|nr:Uncharacterised protein [Salmonella enterica]